MSCYLSSNSVLSSTAIHHDHQVIFYTTTSDPLPPSLSHSPSCFSFVSSDWQLTLHHRDYQDPQEGLRAVGVRGGRCPPSHQQSKRKGWIPANHLAPTNSIKASLFSTSFFILPVLLHNKRQPNQINHHKDAVPSPPHCFLFSPQSLSSLCCFERKRKKKMANVMFEQGRSFGTRALSTISVTAVSRGSRTDVSAGIHKSVPERKREKQRKETDTKCWRKGTPLMSPYEWEELTVDPTLLHIFLDHSLDVRLSLPSVSPRS